MNHEQLQDFIRTEIQIEKAEWMIALPGVITNIPNEMHDLRVDVRPAINILYTDGEQAEYEQILGVPVMMPGSTTSMVNIPMNVGDNVTLFFMQRSMDNFKIGNGQPTAPNSYRKMSVMDAVAVPGIYPFAKSVNNPAIHKFPHSTKDLSIVHNIGTDSEVELRLTQTGKLVINTDHAIEVKGKDISVVSETASVQANQVAVQASQTTITGKVTINGDTTISGNTTISGILTLAGINMNTHVHPGVMSGPAVTGAPQ